MKNYLYAFLLAGVLAESPNVGKAQERSVTATTSPSSSRNIAIFIGVGNYDDPRLQKLTYPTREVEILKKKLVADWNFESKNVFVRKDISRDRFMAFMDSLSTVVTANDNLIFYMSSHGALTNDQNFYFQFTDAKFNEEDTWMPAWLVVNKINEKLKCRKILMLADACFSGSLIDLMSFRGNGIPSKESIEVFQRHPSAEVITAGDRYTRLPDRSEFFAALVQTLDRWKYRYLPASYLFTDLFEIMAGQNSSSIPLYGYLPMIHTIKGGNFVLEKKGGRPLPVTGQSGFAEPGSTPKIDLNPSIYNPPTSNVHSLSKGPLFYELVTTTRNEEYEISASGQLTVGQYLGEVTPDGKTKGILGLPITGYNIDRTKPHGSIMYRISDKDPWTFCGSHCSVKIGKPGRHRLEFRVNDANEGDNSGSFQVEIKQK
jgi:hypothetical protein